MEEPVGLLCLPSDVTDEVQQKVWIACRPLNGSKLLQRYESVNLVLRLLHVVCHVVLVNRIFKHESVHVGWVDVALLGVYLRQVGKFATLLLDVVAVASIAVKSFLSLHLLSLALGVLEPVGLLV